MGYAIESKEKRVYTSLKVPRRLLLLVAASLCSLLAFSVASASASIVPATWVGVTETPAWAEMSGTVKVKRNGASEKTCTISTGIPGVGGGTVWNSEGEGHGDIDQGYEFPEWDFVYGPCTGGATFGIYARNLRPKYNTTTSSYFMEMYGGAEGNWPTSGYAYPLPGRYLWGATSGEVTPKPAFVNGSGIVFNNTEVGRDTSLAKITVTGTVKVNRGEAGANFTLTH
jgi:hypothetical protein